MHETFISLIALALIIPLIMLSLYIAKKCMGSSLKGNQHIKIINQLALGSKERLLLIQINQEVLLVGVTPQNMSTLHVLKDTSLKI